MKNKFVLYFIKYYYICFKQRMTIVYFTYSCVNNELFLYDILCLLFKNKHLSKFIILYKVFKLAVMFIYKHKYLSIIISVYVCDQGKKCC